MIIYTDGATSNNGSENSTGGWAFIAINDEGTKAIYSKEGHLDNTTNNRCELTAIIQACEYSSSFNEKITIRSDSAYCVNCYKQKWYENWERNGWINSSRLPVVNKDLWQQLIPFFRNEMYSFEKVPAHSNNKWNNLVDEKAVNAKIIK